MKNKFANYTTSLLLFCSLFTNNIFSQISPTIEWQKLSWGDEDVLDNPQSQTESGEDWWYSHKNVYNGSAHTGYVTVGYSSLVSKGVSSPALNCYNDIVNYFNEGADSYCNPIVPAYSNFTAPTNADNCNDRDYMGAHRTPPRGMVALNDLNGNMLWCESITDGEMQEVAFDGSFIYVTGSHFGAKPLNNYGSFLSYNPTTANPSDYFSKLLIPGIPPPPPTSDYPGYGMTRHLYVAKLDLNGNIIWEHLYGAEDYSNNPALALQTETYGYDIIKSSNGNLIVGGYTQYNGFSRPLVLEINPLNGNLINKTIMPVTTVYGTSGSTGDPAFTAIGKTLIEIGTTQNYAFGCDYNFTTAAPQAVVWFLNQSLIPIVQNPNPLQFYGSASVIWDLAWHNALQQLLVPRVDVCSGCSTATGKINRVSATGNIIGATSTMGFIKAFDLRVGVCETTDGGFAAVSATKPFNYGSASPASLVGQCSTFDAANSDNYDTDALICKYNSAGSFQWSKVFDVKPYPIRARQPFPGDIKRQECTYKITQAGDGGLVISGNTSHNFDDNYLVKLKDDCQATTVYDYVADASGYAFYVPGGQTITWNTSKKIVGKIKVDGTLIINGATTVIEFADSAYTGVYSGIDIKLFGKLVVNDAHLTSLSGCQSGGMWNGIVMYADWLTKQNQIVTAGNYVQPVLKLNNATISNARHAVMTGKYPFVATSAGGIVTAVNSTFKNNYVDVEYFPYNPNVGTSATNNDMGNFFKCTFVSDNYLNDASFFINGAKIGNKIHVKLNGNKGIQFTGCTFKTDVSGALSSILTDFRGTGIKSFNSTFNVSDYCVLGGQNGCAAVSGNAKFENLETGISASSSNVMQNFKVQDVNFNNCFKGIYQSGVNYSLVQNNKFTINALIPTPVSGCNNIITGRMITPVGGRGLCNPVQYYLLKCDGFKHLNNQYSVSGSYKSIGTLFNACNGSINYSYRNSYTNMLRGHQLQAGNLNLQLKCNDNKFTQAYDVSVTSGIVSQQGGCNSNSAPPNNLFSHSGTPESDLKSASNFQYNYLGNPSGGLQVPLYISSNISAPPCPGLTQPFNYAQNCPIDLGCGLGCRILQVNTISAAIDQNEALLRAGAASSLITVINTQSSGQVKNALMAVGPYLSDEVMITYVGKNNFLTGDVKIVLQANQPLTPAVWNAVEIAGSPTGIYNQLLSAQTGISARDILVENTAQLVKDRQNSINEAVVAILDPSDSTTNYSLVETLLKTDKSGVYDDDLAYLYLTTGQYDNVQAYINKIAGQKGNDDVVAYLSLALENAKMGGDWSTLMQDQKKASAINNIALNADSPAEAQAQAVRNMFIEEGLYDFIEDFNSASGSRLLAANSNVGSESSVNNPDKTYLVYPNPFTNEININYQLNETDILITQLIEIGSGKILFNKVLSVNDSKATVSTKDLSNGIYLLSFIKNNEAPVYYKLINIKE